MVAAGKGVHVNKCLGTFGRFFRASHLFGEAPKGVLFARDATRKLRQVSANWLKVSSYKRESCLSFECIGGVRSSLVTTHTSAEYFTLWSFTIARYDPEKYTISYAMEMRKLFNSPRDLAGTFFRQDYFELKLNFVSNGSSICGQFHSSVQWTECSFESSQFTQQWNDKINWEKTFWNTGSQGYYVMSNKKGDFVSSKNSVRWQPWTLQ